MKKKTSRDKTLKPKQQSIHNGIAAQSAPPAPPAPAPTEIPPGAPTETSPGSPVEVPQPDTPPQPGNAPPPQATTLYIRFLRRRRSWIISRHETLPTSPTKNFL